MKKNSKKAYWQERVEEWSKSGLRQVDYCSTHKIPLSTFSYWKRKLKNDTNSTPVFYPLTLSSEQSNLQAPKESSILLHMQSGRFTIEVEKGFLPSTLSQVINTLEQL